MHSFTFDGLNSRTYCGLYVSGGGTHNSPKRDIESVPVPGAFSFGNLTIDHGRFENIEVSYGGWIKDDAQNNAMKLKSWLSSAIGYKRLEDDYHPDYYRMARFVDGLELSMTETDPVAAVTTVKFDCMPQRWLKTGELPIAITESGQHIQNPTRYPAAPLIAITGTGHIKLTICGKELDISDVGGTMYIDCSIQRAYAMQTDIIVPKDNKITVPNGYPYIKASQDLLNDNGFFHVYYTLYDGATLTSLSLTPRWWTV